MCQSNMTNCNDYSLQTANTGIGIASVANMATNGTGPIVHVFSSSTSATAYIKEATFKALQNTQDGMLRIFIGKPLISGYQFYLYREAIVPLTTQSSFEPSFKYILPLDIYLQQDYVIGISTQNSESIAIIVEGSKYTYPV